MWLLIRILIIVLFFGGCAKKEYIIKPIYRKPPPSSYAVHKATLKPYVVNGKTYYPTIVRIGSKYRGIASWYGKDFHGRKTSSGEYYDMYDYTCAHKTLPMNTRVKVTNLQNGRSVIVRVNDRGPFVKNRIIDLSYVAANDIGMIGKGTAYVEIEVIGFDSTISKLAYGKGEIEISNFAVQIGSFRRLKGAKITRNKYSTVAGSYHAVIKKFYVNNEPLYRVWLVGFRSEAEARDFIKRDLFKGAFVVREF